jgi:hypothetical protein
MKEPPTTAPTHNFRNSDPPTSEAAFRAVEPRISKTHMKMINILSGVRSATASEMMDHCGMIYNSTWRRLSELKTLGFIRNTEETRKNSRGFGEVVFVMTETGQQYLGNHQPDPEHFPDE